jgi:signal transduction histidine kinase
MPQVTKEELRNLPQLHDLSDETLQWIIDRSRVRTFGPDEILVKTGDPIDEMWILIEGSYDFYWDTNGQLTYFRSWSGGEISGLLPYSRMKKSPGFTISTEAGKGLMLHKEYFDEMERRFPDLVKRLIEILTDRVREFTASHQQQEKISALGRMSAGLAHELNNPTAAIQRNSVELTARLVGEIDRVLALIASRDDRETISNVLLALKDKSARSANSSASPLWKSQLEDELNDLLDFLETNDRNRVSDAFAEIGVTADELRELVQSLPETSAAEIILWVENVITSERLATEIHRASVRISQLVSSIKSYVHMDRSYDMQQTDVHGGLDSTLVLLNYKIKNNGIEVVREYRENLPTVQAFAGELNQVWTNIIDNAVDAMDTGGTLTIKTSVERGMVKVSVIDTGTGIPDDIKNKIFDPFFTTKPVGKGVGLGLDMVKQIVTKHSGEIKVFSQPGRTEFVLCFPITEVKQERDQAAGSAVA